MLIVHGGDYYYVLSFLVCLTIYALFVCLLTFFTKIDKSETNFCGIVRLKIKGDPINGIIHQ